VSRCFVFSTCCPSRGSLIGCFQILSTPTGVAWWREDEAAHRSSERGFRRRAARASSAARAIVNTVPLLFVTAFLISRRRAPLCCQTGMGRSSGRPPLPSDLQPPILPSCNEEPSSETLEDTGGTPGGRRAGLHGTLLLTDVSSEPLRIFRVPSLSASYFPCLVPLCCHDGFSSHLHLALPPHFFSPAATSML
jgi:hypothetical protein